MAAFCMVQIFTLPQNAISVGNLFLIRMQAMVFCSLHVNISE